jgi:hypothetical protein
LTPQEIEDNIIESHDIIRSIWRGWENKVANDIKDQKARDKARRSTIAWQVKHTNYPTYTRNSGYYAESPQARGQRMRAHNDCVAANGYGSSYF